VQRRILFAAAQLLYITIPNQQGAATFAHWDRAVVAGITPAIDTYQWGYDDRGTVDSTLVPGETNQNYTNTGLGLAHKYYWVITSRSGCLQKSYYNPPTTISNINAANEGVMNIVPNPNTGSFKLLLSTPNTEKATIVITNTIGQKIKELVVDTNQPTEILLDEATGVYFISATIKTQRFSCKVIVAK
jgi:hypothetical protein